MNLMNIKYQLNELVIDTYCYETSEFKLIELHAIHLVLYSLQDVSVRFHIF